MSDLERMIIRSPRKTEKGFLVDMHIHSHFSSDSFLRFDEILLEAAFTINGIVITDHDIIGSFHLDKNTIEKEHEIVVFAPAVEISSTEGHILAYGITSVPSRELEPEEVLRIIHDEKGLAVAAHPFSELGVGDLVYDLPFDAIEINGARPASDNRKAKEAATLLELPMVGGSDAHIHGEIASCVTQFRKKIQTMDELIAEVKKGRCQPLMLR